MTYSMAWLATAGVLLAVVLFVLQVMGFGGMIPHSVEIGIIGLLAMCALWAYSESPIGPTTDSSSNEDAHGHRVPRRRIWPTTGIGVARQAIIGLLVVVACVAVSLFALQNDAPDSISRSHPRLTVAEKQALMSTPRYSRYYGHSLNDWFAGRRASSNDENRRSYQQAVRELRLFLTALGFLACAIILHFRAQEIMEELAVQRRGGTTRS